MMDDNLIINDQDLMIKKLKTYGYFDLVHNYKDTFRLLSEKYEISQEDIVNLREFDIDLQSLIFKYIIQIENSLKAKISYIMASKFGTSKNEYTNGNNYKNSFSAEKIFKKIENKKHINFKKYPAKYYIDKYNDLPPWVYLKHLPFGDTKNIFKQFKVDDKLLIIDELSKSIDKYSDNDKIMFFTNHINIIHDFRNSIAHGNRLLNYVTTKDINKKYYIDFFSASVINRKKFDKYNKRIMCLILSILLMLNDDSLKVKFIKELENLIELYLQNTSNHFINIIHDVCSLPLNYKKVFIDALYDQIDTIYE